MSPQDRPPYPLAVLVVEDEPDTAESLAELLAIHGHAVRVARDGDDALRQAAAAPPDVVLLDLRIPGPNGCEVARRLCANRGPKRPLLIAVTGCGTDADRESTARAGFDLHLVKPVDPAVLVGLLERFRRFLAPPTPAADIDSPPEDPPEPEFPLTRRSDPSRARDSVSSATVDRR